MCDLLGFPRTEIADIDGLECKTCSRSCAVRVCVCVRVRVSVCALFETYLLQHRDIYAISLGIHLVSDEAYSVCHHSDGDVLVYVTDRPGRLLLHPRVAMTATPQQSAPHGES